MGQDSLKRAGTVLRLPPGASRVKRIGHGVMAVPDVKTTVAWFREMLGFIDVPGHERPMLTPALFGVVVASSVVAGLSTLFGP